MKAIFRGKVINGRPIMGSDYAKFLHTLEGKDIDLTIEPHKKKRSNAQNAYFHAVIVKEISDYTGYETEEVKEMLKIMFLPHDVKMGDKIIRVGRSTAALTTSEFEELNSQCRRWASMTLDLYLVEPNQVKP